MTSTSSMTVSRSGCNLLFLCNTASSFKRQHPLGQLCVTAIISHRRSITAIIVKHFILYLLSFVSGYYHKIYHHWETIIMAINFPISWFYSVKPFVWLLEDSFISQYNTTVIIIFALGFISLRHHSKYLISYKVLTFRIFSKPKKKYCEFDRTMTFSLLYALYNRALLSSVH